MGKPLPFKGKFEHTGRMLNAAKILESVRKAVAEFGFLLRCMEIGISIRDLDLLTIGMVLDIWTEKGYDGSKDSGENTSIRNAVQSDFDRF